MGKRIDEAVGQKFALAAGVLMTRWFSTPLPPNPRRLLLACGPASPGSRIAMPNPDLRFDVLGLGFRPGREWKGPSEVFVEEDRGDGLKVWANCSFWADDQPGGPLYLLTEDHDVCFSYDGHSLVPLSGDPGDRKAGAERARARLRTAARLVPDDLEKHSMM